MCSRGAGLGPPMDPVESVQDKNFSGNTKELAKVLGTRGSLKSFTLTIRWNLAKLVKIFSGIIARQHHTDRKQMGLLRQQYAGLKTVRLQFCCNQVWMKNGGQILWNAKISCLMGRLWPTLDSSSTDFGQLRA